MHNSIGLRLYVSARIIAGLVVGSLGTFLAQAVFLPGPFGALGAFVFWIVSIFVSLIISLQGIIVLLEATHE
jgi:hypothetical protein